MKRLVFIVALALNRLAFMVVFAGVAFFVNSCVAYVPPHPHLDVYFGFPFAVYSYPAYGLKTHFYGGFKDGFSWLGLKRK